MIDADDTELIQWKLKDSEDMTDEEYKKYRPKEIRRYMENGKTVRVFEARYV